MLPMIYRFKTEHFQWKNFGLFEKLILNRFQGLNGENCGIEYVEDAIDNQWMGFAQVMVGPVIMLLCVIIVVARVSVL